MNHWKGAVAGLTAAVILTGSLTCFAACGKNTDTVTENDSVAESELVSESITETERETTSHGELLPVDAVATWDASAASDGSLTAYLCVSENNAEQYTLEVFGDGAMADYSEETGAPWKEYSEKLVSIGIHIGVTNVGAYAFADCWNVSELTLADTVTSVGAYAFYRCSALSEVRFPTALRTVGDYAFCECSDLSSAVFADGLTSVGAYAFQKCVRLAEISVPDSTSFIGEFAFSGTAYYNDKENWDDGLLYVGKYLIRADKTDENGAVTLRDGTLHIGYFAFAGCTADVNAVYIPAGILSIGPNAFTSCRQIRDIYFAGTKEEWLAVEKGENWNKATRNYTVHCSDGDLAKADDV